MRIIAGEFRRRPIEAPEGFSTRPMPDRVKESLFGMLGQRVVGAAFVDLFSGSGSVGLEAVSRGAASAILVERDRRAFEVLCRNIERLGCSDRAEAVMNDALGMSVVARCPRPTDVVFVDPPFPMARNIGTWAQIRAQCAELAGLLAPDGFLIVRTPWPFLMEVESVADAASPGPAVPPVRRLKEKRKKDRYRWDPAALERQGRGAGAQRGKGSPIAPGHEPEQPDDEPGDEPSDELADELADETGDALAGLAPGPKVMGELTIAGTRGPETHIYGKSAVHWYMRAT